LGGVLFQLSPYFKNEGSALDNLKGVLDAVSHQDFNYAVEFRHNSWLGDSRREIDAAALEALRERNVANVLIDGPGLHSGTGLAETTLIFGSMGGTTTSGTRRRRRMTTGSIDMITYTKRTS
jgi:uncharacterized protein YecE (DUF72 family)